jgi:hypothetical protein
MDSRPSRRSLLLSVGTLAGLSGCLGVPGGDEGASGTQSTTSTTQAETGEGDPNETTAMTTSTTSGTETDLDLREANVVEVAFESTGKGSVRFDVTLIHDDDGEDGYANWWQVETLDGTNLGRRTLLHAHGTREFTRSATIEIPEDVACVVVRGHDQTHGYGGQVVLVNLSTGKTAIRRHGPEQASFDSQDCP